MKRIVKQIIIVLTVLAFITAVVLGIRWLRQVKPNCFDGIKNGEEEGVDCGSICGVSCPTLAPEAKPINLKSAQIVQGGSKCDVVAAISNPNGSLGAEHVPYELKWGNIQKQGEFYIYPSEERYVAEVNLPCQGNDMSPQFEVKEPPAWIFFSGYEKPNLEISDSRFNYPKDSYEYAEVVGTVVNHSSFDLKEVEIYAIVKDPSGNITAVNRTTVNSILVGEKRDFRVFWTHPFPKSGTGFFYTTTNLFNSQNFLKTYSADSAKWNVDKSTNYTSQ